jgi:hypothetical protein
MPIKWIGFAKFFCEVILHGLFQWLNFRRQPPCPKRLPARAKFGLVYCRSHNCHFQSPSRQIAVQYLEIVNRYTNCELAIFSVKVSPGMINFPRAEGDRDSIEFANCWHFTAASTHFSTMPGLRMEQIKTTFTNSCQGPQH